MAGGVTLNCVANGKILKNNILKMTVQPAAGGTSGSLGAALGYWHQELAKERKISRFGDGMNGSYLGPSYDDETIKIELNNLGII